MKTIFSYCTLLLSLFLLSISTFSLSTPDLTIVGFFESEGGIGKVPITILETLGEEISANLIYTPSRPNIGLELPLTPRASACLNNTDLEAGKVAMLTDLIWCKEGKPNSSKMPKESIVKLAYSMLETTQIPSMWVKILNEEFDAVVVPDPYVADLYEKCGVAIPIFMLPLPMMLDSYFSRSPHNGLWKTPFVFLDASANKNTKTLIKAFSLAFKNNPNVILFLRAGFLDVNYIGKLVKIYGLNNVYTETEKIPLHLFQDRLLACSCYVNLSRGEGFSFIPRECFALNVPVIITNNTASSTICNTGFARAIPSRIKNPANQHYFNLFGEPCGEQFDCTVKDVVAALKDVYNNYAIYYEKATQGREWVKQYDCNNPILQKKYRTLIKPKRLILGSKNLITEDTITTNSVNLYNKYLKVMEP